MINKIKLYFTSYKNISLLVVLILTIVVLIMTMALQPEAIGTIIFISVAIPLILIALLWDLLSSLDFVRKIRKRSEAKDIEHINKINKSYYKREEELHKENLAKKDDSKFEDRSDELFADERDDE